MHRHASFNRLYRLVWSRVHQRWVAVAESARGAHKGGGRSHARRTLVLASAMLAAAQLAQAGPGGAQLTHGTGSVQQTGNTTTVHQTSAQLSLNWQQFNTAANETVHFIQPSSSAIAVNRILDTNGTQFMGKLNANGQVVLINPNGILFGAGAQVNVGGLVASTLDLSDAALSSDTRRFSGNATGSIRNQGVINSAAGGYVAFIGNTVQNSGSITAPGGKVAFGAGSDVTLGFAGERLLNMQVNASTLNNLAENGGLIRADGGAVLLSAGARNAVLASVVNNTGIIEARSSQEVNGSIVLEGGQASSVRNNGTMDASGRAAQQTGGTVKVLGETVELAAGSQIDASGELGGGQVLVGGNFLGQGPERNALRTTALAGSRIDADAITRGNGGQVAVWSDSATHFDGSINARAGAQQGDGGAVETSGAQLKIGANASVNTLAARGKAGEWLLDPNDFVIGGHEPGDGDVDGALIGAALKNSSVTIKTGAAVSCDFSGCNSGRVGNGDIIIANGALIGGYAWDTGTTLTLSAYRNIELRGTANIDSTNGTGHIVLHADNTARGIGTLILGDNSLVWGNALGNVDVYYNPPSYALPTAYASMRDTGGVLQFGSSNLRTYMLVNFAVSIADKTYDANTLATLGGIGPLAQPVGIDIDYANLQFGFLDKNVGSNKPVFVTGVALTGLGADQYAINGLNNVTGNITRANVNLFGVTSPGKVYDGTTVAPVSGGSVIRLGSDNLAVSAGVGSFATKTAGTAKPITLSGYSLSGTDAANYNLIVPTNLTATISKANAQISGLAAANKVYDANTSATLSGTASISAIAGDVLTLGGSPSAVFVDKNAGTGKGIIVSGYTLSGLDAANYNLVQPDNLSANIIRANLSVSGVAATNKLYDGTLAALLTGTASVAALGTDTVSVSGTPVASFANKNVGTGMPVTVSGYTLTGTDATNYNIIQPSGLSADISKANLALTGIVALDKTYDASLSASLSGNATVSAFGSDVVSVVGSGSAMFATKNAGSNKAVLVSGYALSGLDAGNYQLILPSNLTASINRANLAVSGISVANKVYDATTSASLGGTASVTAIAGDAVALGGSASGQFSDKNAGINKAVVVNGYTLSGLDAANYNLLQPGGLTASIAKASLGVTGVVAANKIYDATTAATLTGTASVASLGSDVVSVTGTPLASFATKNVGSGKTVTVSGYSLSGLDAGNYTIVQPTGLSANIGKANLLLSGLTAFDKTYDGSTSAALGGTATVAPIGADVVNLTGSGSASFGDKQVGTNKLVAIGGYGLAGLDAANYNLVLPGDLHASISTATLALTGLAVANKVYDGSTNARLNGSATITALAGDSVQLGGAGSAAFVDKNAGSGKAVIVAIDGYSLSGLDAGNYSLVAPPGMRADIARANLQVAGVVAANKVYDGTLATLLTGSASVASFGLDQVSVTGTATASFADKNVGTGKTVMVSGYGLSGLDAGNYNIVQPSGLSASISKADLALTGLTAADKIYDGSLAASLSGNAAVAAIGLDDVALSGSASASFADKNAGTNKTVHVSGYTLSGADAGNYQLLPAALSARITAAPLSVNGVSAADKVYDSQFGALLTGQAQVSAIGADQVSVVGDALASFSDKHVGVGKAVSVSGYTLSGADAANYSLLQPAGLSASISKADLTLTGLAAASKVYDGNTAASLTGSASITPIGSDDVILAGSASASFAAKQAAAAKPVSVSGYSISGSDAANYTLRMPTTLQADITRASLVVGGVAAVAKTYDASVAASISGNAFITAIGLDDVAVTGNASASFADKNVGANKAVNVSGYSLSGADAANYTLVQPAGLSASITPAALRVGGLGAADKVYDGGTLATLTGAANVAALGSDSIVLGGAAVAVFADKHAGNHKTVSVSGYTLSGIDAANYSLLQPDALLATITPAVLQLSGVSAQHKVYDGSRNATLSGQASIAAFGDDQLALGGSASAQFADKHAGSQKAVSVSGYTLIGQDSANYTLRQPTLVADISPALLQVSGIVASNKAYDGSTRAEVDSSGALLTGLIGGDALTLSSQVTFSAAQVGKDLVVTLSNTWAGADLGNYQIVDQTSTLASITAPRTAPFMHALAQLQSAPPTSSTGTPSALPDATPPAEPGSASEGHDADTHGQLNLHIGSGPGAPLLRIQLGGIRMPAVEAILD